MKKLIAIAALLATGAAQAQTYQFDVGDGQPGFGFGGSFTFNNGTFSNLNITDSQGATFDQSASGGLDGSSSTLSSYVFLGASGNVGLDIDEPLGTPGLLIENAFEAAPGVPAPGFWLRSVMALVRSSRVMPRRFAPFPSSVVPHTCPVRMP